MSILRFCLCSMLLTFALYTTGFSQTQKGNQILSAGIGIFSPTRLGGVPDQMFDYIIVKDPIVQYRVSVVDRTNFPTLHISYAYALNKKFTFGVTGAYDNSTGSFKQDNEIVGNFRHQYLTVAAEGKYLYLNRPDFCIYGSLGLGGLVYFQNDKFPQASTFINSKSYNFNAFISPIGIRYGKQLGGFLEAGFGYKGILNAGVSYRL